MNKKSNNSEKKLYKVRIKALQSEKSEKTTMGKHKKGCICCRRIANGVSKYTSTVTKQSYKIDGNYTCETNNCIYLVTCGICDEQYVGKTTRSMRKRHTKH